MSSDIKVAIGIEVVAGEVNSDCQTYVDVYVNGICLYAPLYLDRLQVERASRQLDAMVREAYVRGYNHGASTVRNAINNALGISR